jgi:hypothetical protein
MERKETCENCRFWECDDEDQPLEDTFRNVLFPDATDEQLVKWDKDDLNRMMPNRWRTGSCLRMPPTVEPTDEFGWHTWRWPRTSTSDWCGEWQPTGDLPQVSDSERPRDLRMVMSFIEGRSYSEIAATESMGASHARVTILKLLRRRNQAVYDAGIRTDGAFNNYRTPPFMYLREHRKDFGF